MGRADCDRCWRDHPCSVQVGEGQRVGIDDAKERRVGGNRRAFPDVAGERSVVIARHMTAICNVICSILVACIMIQTTSADYTDELQRISVDDVIFDCGDWSAVQNSKDTSLHQHYYWFKRGDRNWWVMCNPATWGLPSDISLHRAGGRADDIAWAYMYVNGFDHTLIDENGIIHTDDPASINYITGYCKYDGFTTQYWLTYEITESRSITTNDDRCVVQNKITFKCKCKDNYLKDTTTLSETIPYNRWDAIDPAINISLTNFTYLCTVLSVETPPGITGIRIDAISPSTTAFYEKHEYYMELNSTASGFKYFDLKKHTFENHSNMAPIGVNLYSLPRDDYNISVTLYTPFEIVDANITVIESDFCAKNQSKSAIKPALLLLAWLFGAIIAIWRV